MSKLLTLFFSLTLTFALSQELERTEINGKILVKSNDVEGVTIYNTSSNKGTVTNQYGEFKINVAVNDIIEISALQFKTKSLTITNEILKTKSLKVFLIEQVNTLDQVVILPYRLTGNLTVDIEDVQLAKSIAFNFGDFSNYDMSDDYKSKVNNIALNNQGLVNGINFVEIAKLLFKTKKKKQKKDIIIKAEIVELTDVFSRAYLCNTFEIPMEQIEAFILFVEQHEIEEELFLDKNRIKLIEYLFSLKAEFLKT